MGKDDTEQESKMDDFVRKLVDLTYCSTEYAVAAWYTITTHARKNPEQAAEDYAKKYDLNRQSFE